MKDLILFEVSFAGATFLTTEMRVSPQDSYYSFQSSCPSQSLQGIHKTAKLWSAEQHKLALAKN